MSYILDILYSLFNFVHNKHDFTMIDKKNQKSIIWALLFAISFVASTYVLSRYAVPLNVSVLVILFNAVIFGIYTYRLIKSISIMDEVQIRIQLESVSIAFVLSLMLVMILGLCGLVKDLGLGNIDYLYIFSVLVIFYIIGFFITQRKYG